MKTTSKRKKSSLRLGMVLRIMLTVCANIYVGILFGLMLEGGYNNNDNMHSDSNISVPLPPQQLHHHQDTSTATMSNNNKKKKSRIPPPKPEGWEQMGFYAIRRHFNCSDYAHDTTKLLLTMEDWQLLRQVYRKHVDPYYMFDDIVLPTDGYNFDGNGNPPPFYASPGDRGRGLFAVRDIKEGELVHDGTISDHLFPTGMSWRRLVFNVPINAACDVIDWTWTQQTEENGEYKLFAPINISGLFNGGNEDTMNINPPSSTSSKFYALKDIKKDEELLTDYDMYDTMWGKVGLGSDEYANDDDDDDADYYVVEEEEENIEGQTEEQAAADVSL